MDQPFAADKWLPSRLWEPDEQPSTPEQISALIDLLNKETRVIASHPYDPTSWLRRAQTLTALRYPELAVGDAHKAVLLCRKLRETLDGDAERRLGARCAFWMSGDPADERERQREHLTSLHSGAVGAMAGNLHFWGEDEERGRCVWRAYPWMEARHLTRSEELVEALNEEVKEACARVGPLGQLCCAVKRYAFGKDAAALDGGREVLGMFATRTISEGQTILVDHSRTWGCNGPGAHGTENLHGGIGCPDPIHPNAADDRAEHCMRWIRDRAGRRAADVLVKCRFLHASVTDGAEHPLDHLAAAGLTPNYGGRYQRFHLDRDIAIPNEALQQFGIDIFANLHYDTWVLFVLKARIENNMCSDSIMSTVHPLFSLFNHSCEPNVSWRSPEDHVSMALRARSNIAAGEQLLVCYDGYMDDEPLHVRRERFAHWINGPCRCSRCLREEDELQRAGKGDGLLPADRASAAATWDTEEKPRLPEDDDYDKR